MARDGTKSIASQNRRGRPNSSRAPRTMETDEKTALTPSTREFLKAMRSRIRETQDTAVQIEAARSIKLPGQDSSNCLFGGSAGAWAERTRSERAWAHAKPRAERRWNIPEKISAAGAAAVVRDRARHVRAQPTA